MERKGLQPTFVDGLTADLGGRRMAEFFAQCEKAIPWQQLADSIADIFPGDADDHGDRPKGGAPHWPLVLMIKCVVMSKWFGLSDPQLEESLMDRLSFRRFVGLSLSDKVPDETTFVNFRKRLLAHGHGSTLFDQVLEHLRRQNLVLKEGTLIDATLIEAPLGQKRVDGAKKELTEEQKAHNRLIAGIRAFVEHPFAWMRKMNFWRARYRGLQRNGLDFALRSVAYNLKKGMSLMKQTARKAAATPKPAAA